VEANEYRTCLPTKAGNKQGIKNIEVLKICLMVGILYKRLFLLLKLVFANYATNLSIFEGIVHL
jgi:hypothetical protein